MPLGQLAVSLRALRLTADTCQDRIVLFDTKESVAIRSQRKTANDTEYFDTTRARCAGFRLPDWCVRVP